MKLMDPGNRGPTITAWVFRLGRIGLLFPVRHRSISKGYGLRRLLDVATHHRIFQCGRDKSVFFLLQRIRFDQLWANARRYSSYPIGDNLRNVAAYTRPNNGRRRDDGGFHGSALTNRRRWK